MTQIVPSEAGANPGPELPSQQHTTDALHEPQSGFVTREQWQDDVILRNGVHEGGQIVTHTIGSVLDEGDTRVAHSALRYAVLKQQMPPQLGELRRMRLEQWLGRRAKSPIWGGVAMLGAGVIMNTPKVRELIDTRDLSSEIAAFEREWPSFTERAISGVENGIKLGYIPTEVRSRLPDALDKTRLMVVDPAVMMATSMTLAAYYHGGNDSVAVEAGQERPWSPDTPYNEALMHELVGHKLAGGTFVENRSKKSQGGITRTRSGFGFQASKGKRPYKNINEALAEHVSEGVENGDFETIDPEQRNEGVYTPYVSYRKIVAAFVESSAGIVQVRSFTNAHFEDTIPGGSFSFRRRLIHEARRAYGPGALQKLEKLLRVSDDVVKGLDDTDEVVKKLDEKILTRIHAPVVDTAGNITEPGRIDVGEG